MRIQSSAEDDVFRQQVAEWLSRHLSGKFSVLKNRGGPGDRSVSPELSKQWEQTLASGGWTCVGWPEKYGGRGLSLARQMIFHEEYARVGAPGRIGHFGEGLLGPTLIAFGRDAQKKRYLPKILSGEEIWCQGYSEPGAGSDLASVSTRAYYDTADKAWRLVGQKVWTSLAHVADHIFVLARVDPSSRRHRGLGFFLVPLQQPEIEVRPIRQMTGDSEFNEVFFDGAKCDVEDMVGEPGEGWKIAMSLLSFERGASTLGQQMQFRRELAQVVKAAKDNGAARDPIIRQRLVQAQIGLKAMRILSYRVLSQHASETSLVREALIYKLVWSQWHQSLGELAMDVIGPESCLLQAEPYQLSQAQMLFLFSRADTIYSGSSEIQKNIIAERALGMPKSPSSALR